MYKTFINNSLGFIVTILTLIHLSSVSTAKEAVPFTAENLIEFSDSLMNQSFKEKRFIGATISIVKDGQTIFSKGYGYADYANKTPVDPAKSQFLIGSVTKVFTATTLMSLVDKGLIDSLDDPANKYLTRIQIPSAFGRVIRVRDLMNHNAGLEDKAFGLGTDVSHSLPLSAEEIQELLPKVRRKNGLVYSNAAVSIAAILIEDVTGKTMDEVYKSVIFQPLNMANSDTGYHPNPHPDLVIPYAQYPNGDVSKSIHIATHPFTVPAGGLSSTADDMAKFMLAHLNKHDNQIQILKDSTRQSMHQRHTDNHPASSGFGHQFIISDWNGHTLSEHEGAWPNFQSIMLLIPGYDAGVFVSFAAGSPITGTFEALRTKISETRLTPAPDTVFHRPFSGFDFRYLFLTHFFGDLEPPVLKNMGETSVDLTKYFGIYTDDRQNFSTNEYVFYASLVAQSLTLVTPNPDGGILANDVPYSEIAPGVFWNGDVHPEVDGHPLKTPLLAFYEDPETGKMRLSHAIDIGFSEKREGLDIPLIPTQILSIGTLLFLTGLLALRWPTNKPEESHAKWVIYGLIIGTIILPVCLMGFYPEGENILSEIILGNSGRFAIMALTGNLLCLLGISALWYAVKAWRGKFWGTTLRGRIRRIHYSLITLFALLMIPAMALLNLVGWQMP
ncbi:MAG: hypothetical protein COB36_09150 [Alphaproteobacteria bacterium]|nr:MAG: hypothetical protein COB36_09150 [Alphaproteobacteria bacterium]